MSIEVDLVPAAMRVGELLLEVRFRVRVGVGLSLKAYWTSPIPGIRYTFMYMNLRSESII